MALKALKLTTHYQLLMREGRVNMHIQIQTMIVALMGIQVDVFSLEIQTDPGTPPSRANANNNREALVMMDKPQNIIAPTIINNTNVQKLNYIILHLFFQL